MLRQIIPPVCSVTAAVAMNTLAQVDADWRNPRHGKERRSITRIQRQGASDSHPTKGTLQAAPSPRAQSTVRIKSTPK
jgi:hypothetical protein